MNVTEHNISEWELNLNEIRELIRLVKDEMEKCKDDNEIYIRYGQMLGKLVLMKLENK